MGVGADTRALRSLYASALVDEARGLDAQGITTASLRDLIRRATRKVTGTPPELEGWGSPVPRMVAAIEVGGTPVGMGRAQVDENDPWVIALETLRRAAGLSRADFYLKLGKVPVKGRPLLAFELGVGLADRAGWLDTFAWAMGVLATKEPYA